MKIFLILFLSFVSSVFGESFYNINGFLGERDSGMGGAFTAISDDASGMYYNPAGIAFALNDTISTSSFNYNFTQKTFLNVTGPSQFLGSSQNYVRTSKGLNPNFIGVISKLGDYRLGFTIINQTTENFDQFNQVSRPSFLSDLNDVKIKYNQDNSKYLYGPSIARNISDKLSIGLTVLGFMDKSRINSTTSVSLSDGSYLTNSTFYSRTSYGVLPILGIQYMPLEKLSIGLSIRKNFNTHGSERKIVQDVQGTNLQADTVNIEDSSNQYYGSYVGTSTSFPKTPVNLIGGPHLNGKIPEPTEIRLGTAYYPSSNFLISMDIIHTTAYESMKNLSKTDPTKAYIVYTAEQYRNLRTKETTNYAMGLEYYIMPYLAIRLGAFTNYANTDSFSNSETLQLLLAEGLLRRITDNTNSRGQNPASSSSAVYVQNAGITQILELPSLGASEFRNEHANLQGYSVGFSYETAKTSLSMTVTSQSGGGRGRLTNVVPVDLKYQGTTVYIITTIRN